MASRVLVFEIERSTANLHVFFQPAEVFDLRGPDGQRHAVSRGPQCACADNASICGSGVPKREGDGGQ